MASAEDDLPETIPDSQPTVKEQLEEQIKALRAQVDDLVSHKEALISTLLTLPTPRQALIEAQQRAPVGDENFQRLLNHQADEIIVSSYRLGVGATLFESKDPNPHAVDNGRVTGIRLENFDRATKSFDKPDYLLLNRPSKQHPDRFRIHKHTLPPSIQVSDLASRYLSDSRSLDENLQRKAEEKRLDLLTRSIRRKSLWLKARRNGINALQARLNNDRATRDPNGQARLRIRNVRIKDAECREFIVTWEDYEMMEFWIGETAIVQGVRSLLEDVIPSPLIGERGVWRGRWEAGMKLDELGAFSAEEFEKRKTSTYIPGQGFISNVGGPWGR